MKTSITTTGRTSSSEVDEVGLQPVVRPLGGRLAQRARPGRLRLPAHVGLQRLKGHGLLRHVEVAVQLPRVPHVEVVGQVPQRLHLKKTALLPQKGVRGEAQPQVPVHVRALTAWPPQSQRAA